MSTQYIILSFLMLAAGLAIPVMATMNGALGAKIGSPFAASVILFFLAFVVALGTTAVSGLPNLSDFYGAPRWWMLGGLVVAFYVIAITTIGPIIGVGQAVFLVLLGQVLSTALIDHFGWLGMPVSKLSIQKVLGLCLIVLGIFLARRV